MVGKHSWRRLVDLYHREPWWGEVIAAFSVVLWAAGSMLSESDLNTRQAMRIALQFMPGEYWELGGIALGLTQLTVLYLDAPRMRKACCVGASWFWGHLWISVFFSDPGAPAGVLYLPPFIANCVSILRLKREPKNNDGS